MLTDVALNSTYGFTFNELTAISIKTVGRNDNTDPTSENYMDRYYYDIWARGGYTEAFRLVSSVVGVINSQVNIATTQKVNVTAVTYKGKQGEEFSFDPSPYLAGTVFDWDIEHNSNFTVTPKLNLTMEHNLDSWANNVVNTKQLEDIQSFPDNSNFLYALL